DIDFTISAWVYFETLPALAGIVSRDGSLSAREYTLVWNQSAARIQFLVFDGSNSAVGLVAEDTLGSPPTGQWIFLTAWHSASDNEVGIVANAGTPTTAATTGAPTAKSTALNI